jgi:hypothetical protein
LKVKEVISANPACCTPDDSAQNASKMICDLDEWTPFGGTLNTSLPMSTGTHPLMAQARDSTGHYFQSTEYVMVQ